MAKRTEAAWLRWKRSWVVVLKGLGQTCREAVDTILGVANAGEGKGSMARPGEKGAWVSEAVLWGTNAPLSGGVRTIDWSSGQVDWETLADEIAGFVD